MRVEPFDSEAILAPSKAIEFHNLIFFISHKKGAFTFNM